MKKSTNVKPSVKTVTCCSRRQKIFGIIALGGLFACGLMVGIAIKGDNGNVKDVVESQVIVEEPTCAVIEEALSARFVVTPGDDWGAYLHNANVFATMAERGCPENAEKYKAKALRSLEVADALQYGDTIYYDDDNVENVIDTYKKIGMQKQAREFLDKVQKLTDPAIDFILQMEKIINE